MTTTAAATTWTADTVHSTAGFAVKHSGVATFRGSFDDVTGTLDLSQASRASPVRSTSRASRSRTRTSTATSRARTSSTPANTPKITFESTSVSRDGDDVTIEGDLTIKGTTQRVTATGTWLEIEADMTGNPRIGVDISTTIDRTAFGLNWNAPLPKGGVALANDVTLNVHLELVPAQG